MSDAPGRVAPWVVAVTFALSLVGLALSIYLTIAHYEGTQILACSDRGLIDCAKVTTSAQSHFFGVPVSLIGLCGYVVLAVMNSPWGWRAPWRWWHVARFVLVTGSMCFVMWLVYAELVIIDNICLYCTYVHVTTFLLLLVVTRVSPAQLGWVSSRSREQATL